MKLFDVYPLFDIAIDHGKGCHVTDTEGVEYLDLYGGHAVISIGHSHPRYLEALNRQAAKLVFYSNSVINPLQQQLADLLGEASGYPDYQLFLVNSGAEANENALKLASFVTGRRRVIAFSKAFHGRTSLAVEATDNPKIQAPVNRNDVVTVLPWNDTEALARELEKEDVAAVIIEPIQGVGGIQVASDEFLKTIRELTSAHGTLMITDEIQCGYGRSGRFFAHQYSGVRPDIITMAKGIANGFPMGGLLIAPDIKPVYGMLGTTFGGNHLACAAAIAVLEVMKDENLLANVTETGNYLMEQLKGLPGVREVRGRGLMIGIEMEEPMKQLRSDLIHKEHIFTGASGTNVIRLLPPLCLTRDEADRFISSFRKLLGVG
ncbi:MAG: aminotransferase class III-fold pyridoxal phosphate-dependent enzyme [Bacteroidales bacterium]|nr:aminotransferase class III-fold pyridoxal phosphate-dependent enzyme [Bacteroidales bacterium]MDE6081530.1 aminotransferase class III-fold pyridoxal phosphate-dependent enzyme [Muribaculaceae bacterium]